MKADSEDSRNEEKTWVISKKGDKIICLGTIIGSNVLGIFPYFYFRGLRFFDIVDLFFYFSIILIDLIVFLIFKSASNWENPKIMIIKNNTIITEEKFPDGEIQRQEVPIDGIYRITMKRRVTLIEYKLPDGREFIWRFIRARHAREDREKLKEALEEILKRVDKDKVEIVRKA